MKKHKLSATDLKLTARIDRPSIHAEGKSVRFLVVDVTAPTFEEKDSKRTPLNLALVIDASGSMQGEPIEAAKKAARLVAGRLGADDRLSVISFDDEVTTHVNGRRQDADGQSAAASAIGSLQAGSCTDLGAGWLRGCECVARVMEEHPGLRNRVVLLSDGHANRGITDPDALASHAAELRQRGLLSSTVGIGEGYSDAQLEAISASGGGRLHHASRAEEIVELVLAELEESRATVVDGCELVLETPKGFHAEVVGDYAVTRAGGNLSCAIGSLPGGGSRSAVFKITCGEGKLGGEAKLAIRATWRAAEAEKAFEIDPLAVKLEFASGARCLAQSRDNDLALRVARAWQLAVVRAATHLNQDGALERAASLVEQEMKYLERYCKGLPDAKPLLHALRRLARSIGQDRYEPMAAKEMLNASKKTLRSEREHRVHVQASWDSHLPR